MNNTQTPISPATIATSAANFFLGWLNYHLKYQQILVLDFLHQLNQQSKDIVTPKDFLRESKAVLAFFEHNLQKLIVYGPRGHAPEYPQLRLDSLMAQLEEDLLKQFIARKTKPKSADWPMRFCFTDAVQAISWLQALQGCSSGLVVERINTQELASNMLLPQASMERVLYASPDTLHLRQFRVVDGVQNVKQYDDAFTFMETHLEQFLNNEAYGAPADFKGWKLDALKLRLTHLAESWY